MTPTPPSGSNPLIYRIADALGVFHLVAPVTHTHTIAEITDLDSYIPDQIAGGASGHEAYFAILSNGAIAGSTNTGFGIALRVNGQTKIFEVTADTIENLLRAQSNPDSTPTAYSDKLVTSGGVKAALDQKANSAHSHSSISGDESSITIDGDGINLNIKGEEEVLFTVENLPNLARALNDPDAQPIDESDNLITSGAVYAALNSAIRMRRSTNIPDFNVALLEKGIVYNYIFFNNSGEEISLLSCFDISSLPVSERNLYITENGDGVTIGDGEQFGSRICRLDDGVFVEFLGLFV